MTLIGKTGVRITPLLISVVTLTAPAGCGKDFENEPRDPVAVELTGVIKPEKVTVSPDRVGAGPVLIIISNQTDEAHTVTLAGASVEERIGPVVPGDRATIQKTLAPGNYKVRAGASGEISPDSLTVGPERRNSNDQLLLP